MKQLFLSLLLLLVIKTASAQTTGQISYKMDFSTDNPDMAMALSMMEGSTMDLFFIPGKAKTNVQMGSFMKMVTTTDIKLGKGLMLMEMMGSKTATALKISDTAKKEETEKPQI